jgi:hypothetical protein
LSVVLRVKGALESTHRGSEVEESKSRNKREQQNKKPMERTVFMAGTKQVERMERQ